MNPAHSHVKPKKRKARRARILYEWVMGHVPPIFFVRIILCRIALLQGLALQLLFGIPDRTPHKWQVAWKGRKEMERQSSAECEAPASLLQTLPGGFRSPSDNLVYQSLALAVTVSFFLSFIVNWRRRRRLIQEQQATKAELERVKGKEKEIRIFMDGAFDLMHFGHMNAFRLAKALGTHLVVGVNSDLSITECKGAPLMNDEERLTMVQACKFVDEVVPDCPYIMNAEYLEWVTQKYNIDYVVHGDDPCIVDGKDVYATAKATGRFRTIPRTEGVSTTDIVGRILSATQEKDRGGIGSRQSKFLTTNRMLQSFGADPRPPTKETRVVYIDGAWDLFHPGHVAILRAAKKVSCKANSLTQMQLCLTFLLAG